MVAVQVNVPTKSVTDAAEAGNNLGRSDRGHFVFGPTKVLPSTVN